MDDNNKQNDFNSANEKPLEQEPAADLSAAPVDTSQIQPEQPSAGGLSTDGIIRKDVAPATPAAPEAAPQPELAAMEVEQEPSTVSTNPVPQPVAPVDPVAPTVVSETAAETSLNPTAQDPMAIPAPQVAAPSLAKSNKLLIIVAAGSLLLLVIVGIAIWLLLGSKNDTTATQESTTQRIQEPRLGVAVTVADGTVEYLKEDEWTTVDTSTELNEGDTVRTGIESRAVLALDDGSAIRLDAESSVQLIDLTASHVDIKQIDGTVYSRVVSNSERRYTVSAPSATYEALGTAFVTISKDGASGIQVYQSSVKTNLSDESITEGKQYYDMHTDDALQGKLTDINIDALVDDPFINWNLSEDEKDASLQGKLGILPQIKERAEAKEQERQEAEAAARLQAEKEAAEKAAKEREAKEKEAASNQKVTRGTMKLTATGDTLSWTYTGKAVHGYKVVYAKSMTPTFGRDEAVYVSDMNITSTELPKHLKKGRYYVRVCAYTADTEKDKCVDYSTRVSIDL